MRLRRVAALLVLAFGLGVGALAPLVLAQSDTDPPHLVSMTVEPRVVTGTGSASQLITFTVHVTDDLSGITEGSNLSSAFFKSPSGKQSLVVAIWYMVDEVYGTPQDGTYVIVESIPQYAEYGVWRLYHLILIDQANNWRTYDEDDLISFPVSFWVAENGLNDVYLPAVQRDSSFPGK